MTTEEATEKQETVDSPATETVPEAAPPKKGAKGSKGKKTKKAKNAASTEKQGDAINGEIKEGNDASTEEKPKKPVKKIIPHWATLSESQVKAKAKASSVSVGASGVTVIIDAINSCANEKGMASYILIKKHVQKQNPSWPKMVFKGALRRAVQKGQVKQIRNSYKVISEAPKQSSKSAEKKTKSTSSKKAGCPLEELFPHIFTWVCEPKEASYALIRKYVSKHFPNLYSDIAFKKAMAAMVSKGQLDQITAKGASGTFQLVDGAKKTGSTFEDPVEDAIIASNEPKDASIPALRHYLSEYHTEYNVSNKPKVLLGALERAENKGWITRISGKGLSGSFRLAYAYIPSPKDLWRGDYDQNDYEPKKRQASKTSKTADSSSDDSSEESDDDDFAEVMPTKKNRGGSAPVKRGAPAAKKAAPPAKKKKAAPAKKSTPAKKTAPKKTPAKKKAAPKKKSASKKKGKKN